MTTQIERQGGKWNQDANSQQEQRDWMLDRGTVGGGSPLGVYTTPKVRVALSPEADCEVPIEE